MTLVYDNRGVKNKALVEENEDLKKKLSEQSNRVSMIAKRHQAAQAKTRGVAAELEKAKADLARVKAHRRALINHVVNQMKRLRDSRSDAVLSAKKEIGKLSEEQMRERMEGRLARIKKHVKDEKEVARLSGLMSQIQNSINLYKQLESEGFVIPEGVIENLEKDFAEHKKDFGDLDVIEISDADFSCTPESEYTSTDSELGAYEYGLHDSWMSQRKGPDDADEFEYGEEVDSQVQTGGHITPSLRALEAGRVQRTAPAADDARDPARMSHLLLSSLRLSPRILLLLPSSLPDWSVVSDTSLLFVFGRWRPLYELAWVTFPRVI